MASDDRRKTYRNVAVVLEYRLVVDVDVVVGGAAEVRVRQTAGRADVHAADAVAEGQIEGGDRETVENVGELRAGHRLGGMETDDDQVGHGRPSSLRTAGIPKLPRCITSSSA